MRSSAWLLILGIMALVGCRPYVMSSSAVDAYPRADQQIEFMAAVEKMPAVTNNDALHALLMLQDGDDANVDYAARVQDAIRRGWLADRWSALPNEAARVGWMASAGCVVMQVKGGLSMHLLGPTPRYATKELVFMEILPLRTENQVLTGAEFIDYLNRLERMAGKNRRAKADSPLGVPAGESAVSPGDEGSIQEGSLPAQGPREDAPEGDSTRAAPVAPAKSTPAKPVEGSSAAPTRPASQVPGAMVPGKKPARAPSDEPGVAPDPAVKP
jgi:hypothetical protein